MSTSKRTTTDEERKRLLQNYNKRIQEKASTEDEDKSDEKALIIAFLLMLVFQLGNRIFGRLQTYPMHNYPLFLNLLLIVVYIPICFVYVIPMIAMGSSAITKEQMEIPKYKFAIMGAYDSLAGIMQTFAINYITNSAMIVLVQQSAIPISMVISRYALQAQYSTTQYAGAAVVLFGIVVVLIPNFFSDPSVDPSAVVADPTTQLIWLLVLVVSCVPMCLSSVYKEKALGEMEIDIMYLNGWVAVFQFIIAIPLCLPSAYVLNMPFDQIMPNMYDGFMCWLGYNTITADHNPNNLPLDDCGTAPLFVSIYLVFNVVFNILIVIILKIGSSNIMYMASTVIVPLSNVAFSLHFMPGHQPMRFWDIIGLVVIMTGLVIYRFSKDIWSLYLKLRGLDDDAMISEAELRAKRKIAKFVERKQLKFLGFNQMEHLQSLFDTRVLREQSIMLFRSPGQIRSTFLAKIGIPPSPHITMSGPGRQPSINPDNPIPTHSPMIPLSASQRQPSFRATSSGYAALSSSYRSGGIIGSGYTNLSSSTTNNANGSSLYVGSLTGGSSGLQLGNLPSSPAVRYPSSNVSALSSQLNSYGATSNGTTNGSTGGNSSNGNDSQGVESKKSSKDSKAKDKKKSQDV